MHLFFTACEANAGDALPSYGYCVENCEQSGCVDSLCFNSCTLPVSGVKLEENPSHAKLIHVAREKFLKEPLYLQWKKWDCTSECRYHCMLQHEVERESRGDPPVKYHGKWPFIRIFSFQEPASVAFSLLNILVHFQGLSAFLVQLYYKLPLRAHGIKGPYYEYAGLWTIYGILSLNFWIWSIISHSRDVVFTGKLDYSSSIALVGYSLILAIIRVRNVKAEATRVMVSAPIIAFVSTHILYLNLYNFDYGLNARVHLVMAVAQLSLWGIWGWVSSHPARYKLYIVVLGASLGILLDFSDFPPLWGVIDAHATLHAASLPLNYLWWSFIRADASFRTATLASRTQASAINETKKTQ